LICNIELHTTTYRKAVETVEK